MTSAQAVRLQKQGYEITVQAAWDKRNPTVQYAPRFPRDRDSWITASGHRYRVQQLNSWN